MRKSLIDELAKNATALGEESLKDRQTVNYIQSLKIESQVLRKRLPRRFEYTGRNARPAPFGPGDSQSTGSILRERIAFLRREIRELHAEHIDHARRVRSLRIAVNKAKKELTMTT